MFFPGTLIFINEAASLLLNIYTIVFNIASEIFF